MGRKLAPIAGVIKLRRAFMAIIKFGSYPQGSTREPIEWLVLKFKGNEAFLVSRFALDGRPYNGDPYMDVTWENCDLRKWLNGKFLKKAFTPEEQSMIKLSKVQNDDNPEYGTRGGNTTRDRIFCLSLAEAERYFKNDAERRCRPTDLANDYGAFVNSEGHCWWWLRSPGDSKNNAAYIFTDGTLYPDGYYVHGDDFAVRPAMWVKLASLYLSAEPL